MLPYERERFALAGPDRMPVALYGDGAGPETLECQRNATFKILSRANDAGAIALSVCPEHVARLRALAAAAPHRLDRTLAELQKGAPPVPADRFRAAGLYSARSTTPGGAELHYFPVILIGHGALVISTVVLLTDTQAVVAQAQAIHLCGEGGDPFPLCADPHGTLSAIAQRLLSPGR